MATEKEYFTAWLTALGLPVTQSNLNALYSVSQYEGQNNYYNPLNAVQKAPGSKNWNSVGVQMYPDFATGVKASAQLFSGTPWVGVRQALAQGNDTNAILNAFAKVYQTWGSSGDFTRSINPDWANRSIGPGAATGVAMAQDNTDSTSNYTVSATDHSQGPPPGVTFSRYQPMAEVYKDPNFGFFHPMNNNDWVSVFGARMAPLPNTVKMSYTPGPYIGGIDTGAQITAFQVDNDQEAQELYKWLRSYSGGTIDAYFPTLSKGKYGWDNGQNKYGYLAQATSLLLKISPFATKSDLTYHDKDGMGANLVMSTWYPDRGEAIPETWTGWVVDAGTAIVKKGVHAAEAALSWTEAFAKFLTKILWIFNVDHFMRVVLYVLGLAALISGTIMVVGGSKIGAEA